MHFGFFDGACAGNPGRIGLGISICDSTREIALGAGPVEFGTNNDAEYQSLIKLLESALLLEIAELRVYGDSQLIINHVNGKWSAGDKFRPMLARVNQLRELFQVVEFHWIPRKQNGRADRLSKRGLELSEWKFLNKLCPKTENSQSAVVNQNHTSGKSQSDRCEIRIGNKFAVYVDDQHTYVIELKANRCSCGVAGCNHIQVIEGIKAA